MAKRQITCSTKDNYGEITHVGGKDNYGSSFYEAESTAVYHIENHQHEYYTYADGQTAEVIVVTINGKKHLRTTSDSTTKNNLSSLNDC